MTLEGDRREVEVTPDLALLVTFGMSLEGIFHELYTFFTTSSYLIWRRLKIPRKNLPPIRDKKVMS
jgi:hypothetical protein